MRLTATRCTLTAAALLGVMAASAPADDMGTLKWMAGCWEQRAGARVTHETWMPPQGGMMLGMSRTIVRDTVREYEHLRVELRDGKVTYVAKPARQAETAFSATNVTDTLVVFENLAHDFPQRIMYRRVSNDSLVARIEGPQGGQTRGINFPMKRTSCGG